MTPPEKLTSLSHEALVALVAVLQRPVAALRATNDALRADIARLTREGKRQAAPFSKGSRVSQPKRPGRKPGAGTFHYHEAPVSAQNYAGVMVTDRGRSYDAQAFDEVSQQKCLAHILRSIRDVGAHPFIF